MSSPTPQLSVIFQLESLSKVRFAFCIQLTVLPVHSELKKFAFTVAGPEPASGPDIVTISAT